MHLTHNFPFLYQAVLDSNAGCDTLRFVVVDAIYLFLFKGDVLRVTRVVQLYTQSTFGLFMKPKYKCYRCFHGNQLSHGTSKQKVCYFWKL